MMGAGRLGTPHVPYVGWGTAGRDIDTAETYVTLGDGSDGESGITTVHVQLFDGRDPTVPLDAQTGQGCDVTCQLGQGIATMPPFGARVLVVTPNSYGTMPGNSVILYVLDASARDLEAGETCFAPTVGGSRGIARKDGTFEMGAPSPAEAAALASTSDAVWNGLAQALSTAPSAPLTPAALLALLQTAWGGTPTLPSSPPTTTASAILKLSG